ncbi:TonB-dependent receptor plug domain-containing protein [Phenylobacterium sp. LjRoot219]|uniref:TonB-dependent receptor plug domain-containing protein n=1 Tax=Phenylobacterium sp. LjRoot219 TaxID=3342283 RepID=UPI003ED134AC
MLRTSPTARLVLLAGAAAAALAALPAHAESAPEVGELVVTAQRAATATKTDTRLIETPQAISVVTAAQIADRGALTLQETLRYSAGVTSEAYGLDARQDQPVARGFYATQYLDGMRTLFGYSLIPRAEVYTLDRVELLRGPSSVLYGPLHRRRPAAGEPLGLFDRERHADLHHRRSSRARPAR